MHEIFPHHYANQPSWHQNIQDELPLTVKLEHFHYVPLHKKILIFKTTVLSYMCWYTSYRTNISAYLVYSCFRVSVSRKANENQLSWTLLHVIMNFFRNSCTKHKGLAL